MGLLLLPFTLAFTLLVTAVFVLPFMLLRAVLKLATAIVVLPLVLIFSCGILLVAGLAFSLAILAPLAPFAIVALLVYALMRRSPAASVRPG
jgi:hypothetical protein